MPAEVSSIFPSLLVFFLSCLLIELGLGWDPLLCQLLKPFETFYVIFGSTNKPDFAKLGKDSIMYPTLVQNLSLVQSQSSMSSYLATFQS